MKNQIVVQDYVISSAEKLIESIPGATNPEGFMDMTHREMMDTLIQARMLAEDITRTVKAYNDIGEE